MAIAFGKSLSQSISEILFIARKRKKKEKLGLTVYVGLRRNPTTIHEALDLASRLTGPIKELSEKQGQRTIKQGDRTLCSLSSLPAPIEYENWTSAIFSQVYLAQIHFHLSRYSLFRLPGDQLEYELKLCRLDELGTIGYDIRDIADAFEVERGTENWTPYAGFWDHDADRVTQIAQEPSAYLTPRTEAIEGRKLKSHEAVWGKAGDILLVSRLRTNTHKLVAINLTQPAIGNTWWAFSGNDLSNEQKKALLLWLNSSAGMLLYFGSRAITQGAWVQMKKPAWSSMSVLNVRALTKSKLKKLAESYDQLAQQRLKPLAQVDSDPVRIEIDDAISKALGIPSLAVLRELLVREPGLTGHAPVSTGRT